jgi:hypothetical protein
LETYNKFKELMQREGTSVSQALFNYMFGYVQDHYPGNPQPVLGKFLDPPPAKAVCPTGEKNDCPLHPEICVHRKRFACKFDPWVKKK